MNGQKIGYARVSTADQNPDRQLAALDGCDATFTDYVSGKDTNRPKLQEMLNYIREGDVVQVKSVDRLARNARDLLDLVEQIQAKGAEIEFLDNPELNSNDKYSKFTLTVLAAVAELERSMIRERQAEGIAIARAKGKFAKKPKLTEEQVKDAKEKVALGVPKTRVARELGVSRVTLNAALNGEGVYAKPRA